MTSNAVTNKLVQLMADSAANTVKLMNCARHLFDFAPYMGPSSVKVIHCVRCEGRQGTHAALAYIEGYLATGRPLVDVAINAQAVRFAPRCVCPRCEGKSAPDDPRAWPEGVCLLCASVGSLPRPAAVEWLNNKSVKGSGKEKSK